MPFYNVDNYAMPNLVPCIVVGYEDVDVTAEAAHDMIALHAQAGGLSCAQMRAVGYVLRIAAAAEFARSDPWPLVRAFQDISDDRTHTTGPSDDVGFAGGTSGEPLNKEILAQLDAVLAKYFRLPPLDSGIEAFARFDVVDVLAYFEDWPLWTIAARDGSEESRWVEDYGSTPIAESYVATDALRFAPAHVARLQTLARTMRIEQPVRAFLVWGNSD